MLFSSRTFKFNTTIRLDSIKKPNKHLKINCTYVLPTFIYSKELLIELSKLIKVKQWVSLLLPLNYILSFFFIMETWTFIRLKHRIHMHVG